VAMLAYKESPRPPREPARGRPRDAVHKPPSAPSVSTADSQHAPDAFDCRVELSGGRLVGAGGMQGRHGGRPTTRTAMRASRSGTSGTVSFLLPRRNTTIVDGEGAWRDNPLTLLAYAGAGPLVTLSPWKRRLSCDASATRPEISCPYLRWYR
jgi:hypothetical protein